LTGFQPVLVKTPPPGSRAFTALITHVLIA
jgi:hypothetical protein